MGTWFVRYTVSASPPIPTARKRRNAATLLGIIQRQVQPSSILHTDQWVSYRQIQRQLGLNHRTVNYSLHFVDPATGVHTTRAKQLVDNKRKLKKVKGNTNPKFLIEYLHEFMWRRWYGDTHPNGYFQRFLQDIAEQNPF